MEQTIFVDTIFALSSGALPSGIAVVRISGPGVRRALEALCGCVPAERRAGLRKIRTAGGEIIDSGLVLFFAGPNSFTGEDVAEVHVHGGRAVAAAILGELGALDGLRQAEAGEFTRRAFLNGKMDLTGAEALADLIASETEAQRRFAVANTDGRQGVLYQGWRRRILQARVMIEAELDFADEADVGAPSTAAWPDMHRLIDEIGAHLASYHRAEIVRDGFRVVIVGAPNAGKSSLLNALAAREVAIVTEEAGTTRDLIEVPLDLGGVKVLVTDTAGLREGGGRVEAIGIDRARRRAAEADLILLLTDLSKPLRVGDGFGSVPIWAVGTKVDLTPGVPPVGYDYAISVRTEEGLGHLLEALKAMAVGAAAITGVVPSRLRHVELLSQCMTLLKAALSGDRGLELGAEDLRLAGDALGRIVGSIDVEELLGAIFSSFCIGK